MAHEWRREEYTISDDPRRLDLDFIHRSLSTDAYWAQGRTLEVVRRSFENSLPFGVYTSARQVGFARVVTDRATFAWLADVYVDESERGRGLGKWLVEVVMSHPEVQNLRRWILATRDAHGLYRQFGFENPAQPESYMEKLDATAIIQSGSAAGQRKP